MGWPSFREDIIERLNADTFKEDLKIIRDYEPLREDPKYDRFRKAVEDQIPWIENTFTELMKYLDVITDPDNLSLIDKCKEYEEERQRYRLEIGKERRINAEITASNFELRGNLDHFKNKSKECQKELKKALEKIKDLVSERNTILDRKAQEEMYDDYPPEN